MSLNNGFKLGELQTLVVVKATDFGVYLAIHAEEKENTILLPKNSMPEGLKVGHYIEVFVYRDSEDRLIATTTKPALQFGQVAKLNVKDVGTIGAFLDWGLVKDLLLPFKEQTYRPSKGEQVLVTLYIDKSNRLCATMKVYEYLSTSSTYKKDDMVTGLVYEISEQFGAFVAVDDEFSALIPASQLFNNVEAGSRIEARVTNVKEDGKLDLSIRQKVHLQMDEDATLIYTKLEQNNGFLPFHDKSAPEDIKDTFKLSKNAFKRALGRLLKEDKITQEEKGIRLK